jgi:hypothetical protein
MRDYLKWHDGYDDPSSDLSWRLRQAQAYIRQALDHLEGPVTVISLCAGDGRDVLQVLADRNDSARVRTTLIELHPVLAQRARTFAADAGLTGVTVRSQDAGNTTAYAGSVPADLVIMMGIFGNISDDDVRRTIQTARSCADPVRLCYGRAAQTAPTRTRRSGRGWPMRASPSWAIGNSIKIRLNAPHLVQPATAVRFSRSSQAGNCLPSCNEI